MEYLTQELCFVTFILSNFASKWVEGPPERPEWAQDVLKVGTREAVGLAELSVAC